VKSIHLALAVLPDNAKEPNATLNVTVTNVRC